MLWAIRDVKHGKTFWFDTLDDLFAFVHKLEQSNETCQSSACQ